MIDKKYRVPKQAITEKGLKKLIRDQVKKHASQHEWAQKKGVQTAGVSAFMRKTQSPGLAIPAAVGYKPQVVYIPIGMDPIQTAYPSRRATAKPTAKTDRKKPTIEKPRSETKAELKKRLKKRNKKNKGD